LIEFDQTTTSTVGFNVEKMGPVIEPDNGELHSVMGAILSVDLSSSAN
jgi:hypothetical protein